VVERVRTQHRGERPVAERQVLGVCDLEVHVPDSLREVARLADHLRRQVDADDRGGQGRRGSGGRARAAPDVEQPILGAEMQGVQGRLLDRVAPSGRDPRVVVSGPPIEPPASIAFLVTHRASVRAASSLGSAFAPAIT
jgi:hypothetical protein